MCRTTLSPRCCRRSSSMALEQARLLHAAVAMSALLVSACATRPAPPATTAQTPYLRQTLNPKWLQWPPNDGFSAGPISETLAAGTLIERFGSENGRFFSPQGESYAARALPYVCSTLVYRVY